MLPYYTYCYILAKIEIAGLATSVKMNKVTRNDLHNLMYVSLCMNVPHVYMNVCMYVFIYLCMYV